MENTKQTWQEILLEVEPAAADPSFEDLWDRVPEHIKEENYDNDFNTYVTAVVLGKVRLL
jgi:hypothetical protein